MKLLEELIRKCKKEKVKFEYKIRSGSLEFVFGFVVGVAAGIVSGLITHIILNVGNNPSIQVTGINHVARYNIARGIHADKDRGIF